MLSLLALVAVPLILHAQKLPKIQEGGFHAPAYVKIDGQPVEWNKFQAYNTSTRTFYTIANDSDRLYLAIHVADYYTMQKLLQGGVTLSVLNNDKKLEQGAIAITFPFLSQAIAGGALIRIKDTATNMQERLVSINNQLTTNATEIRVTGVSGITDTIISVYNEYGIKAAIAFDMNRELTYELSVPLKYLKERIDNSGRLKYNVKINGIKRSLRITMGDREIDPNSTEGRQLTAQLSDPNRQNIIGVIGSAGVTRATGSFAELMNATDFTGNYVLAK